MKESFRGKVERKLGSLMECAAFFQEFSLAGSVGWGAIWRWRMLLEPIQLLRRFWLPFASLIYCAAFFGEGALQAAFVPQFEALRIEGDERARHFFRHLTVFLFLLLVAIVLLVELGIGFSTFFLAVVA